MKILQKIKVLRRQEMRPLLKPAVLALVLGAAYGLGKCSGENNGERRLAEKDRQFAAKEQAYLRKIDDLSIKANPFRFYEIDGSGHEVAEFEKIRREPMPEEMRNRFGKYRMREISPEEIVRLDTLLERKGIELKDYEQKPERLQALSARLQDTIGVMGDESYLQDAAEYRRLMVAELCRLSRAGHRRHDFRPFKMRDEDLALEVRMRPAVINTKLRAAAYRNVYEYRRDVLRVELMRRILEMRQIVRKNNEIIEDMRRADSLVFANDKEAKIKRLRRTPPEVPVPYEAFMQKFSQQAVWAR